MSALVPLKSVADINTDTLSERTDSEFNIRYIDIGSVSQAGFNGKHQEFTFDAAPSRARCKLRKGSTIIATVRTYLKAVAYFDNPQKNEIVSTGFAVLDPKSGIDPRYLYYRVAADDFVQQVEANSVGVSYPAINPSDLGKLKLSVSGPSGEQKKLADFLDYKTQTLDKMLTAKSHTHTQLSELRQAIINRELFNDRDGTMKVQLCRIVTLQTAKQGAISDVPIITLENVESWTGKLFGYTAHENVSGELVAYKKGDVLFNKLRPYLAKVHVAESDGLCTGEMLVLRPNKDKVNSRYLFYFLVSNKTISDVDVATYGVKMPRANWETIGSLEVDLPLMEEQQKIVDRLDVKLAQIEVANVTLKKSIAQLEEYRSSLISNVVGGKVEV